MGFYVDWVTIVQRKIAVDPVSQGGDMVSIPTHLAATALRRKKRKSPKK